MSTETLQPDGSVFALTNLTGAATDVDEGVDTPDSTWLTLGDDGTNSVIRASFPTPTGDPTTGAGLQKFRMYVRVGTAAGGNDPTLDIAVRETGGADLAAAIGVPVTSHVGEVIEFTWDATVLSTADGSAVELYVIGQRSGGSPSGRRSVEFDAIEWVVDYSVGGITYDETGKTVTIVSAVSGTDVAVFVESLSVAVAATVDGSDSLRAVETGVVSIVATVTGTDDLIPGSTVYDETGHVVAIVSTVTGTDTATFVESLTVAITAALTGSDRVTFVESLTIEAVGSVTENDKLRATESGTVTASVTITGTDVATFTESSTISIFATVTGTDNLNQGSTVYDETGLIVAAVMTVTGTDFATFVESGIVAIVATVTGNDTIASLVMSRSDPVKTTASNIASVGAAVEHTRMLS